jgi:hypothetical protein
VHDAAASPRLAWLAPNAPARFPVPPGGWATRGIAGRQKITQRRDPVLSVDALPEDAKRSLSLPWRGLDAVNTSNMSVWLRPHKNPHVAAELAPHP